MTTTQPTTTTTTAPSIAATRPLSTIALFLGIASVVFGQTFLVPIAAMVIGYFGYKQEPLGRAFAVWGIVLGALMLFGWMLFAAVGFAFAAPFLSFSWM